MPILFVVRTDTTSGPCIDVVDAVEVRPLSYKAMLPGDTYLRSRTRETNHSKACDTAKEATQYLYDHLHMERERLQAALTRLTLRMEACVREEEALEMRPPVSQWPVSKKVP